MPPSVESKLGRIEQVFRVRNSLRRNRLTASVVLVGGAILAWAVAAGRAFLAYVDYGPLLVGRWVWPPLVVGVLLALLGLWFGIGAWNAARLRIRLHSAGLAVVRGRRGHALAWVDVLALWSRSVRTGLPGLPGRLHYALELEARDGRRLRLEDSLEGFGALAEAVKSRVYSLLAQASTQAFNQGETLFFGPIQISPAGISDGGRMTYPWSAVNEAQLASGRLIIRAHWDGKSSEVAFPADRIPNVELCAQLIQEIGRQP